MKKIQFKFTDQETEYSSRWFSFYPKFEKQGFRFTFSPWSYFDPRPQIVTSVSSILTLILIPLLGFWSFLLLPFLFLSWGQLFVYLPYNSGKDQYEYPDYGIMFYSVNGEIPNHIWIRNGNKSKTINLPWAYKFWKKEVMLKDGKFHIEDPKKPFYYPENQDQILKLNYPYQYTLNNGQIQHRIATIHEEKRYWKNWFGLNVMKRHTIEINFSDEVGEKSGSWKGGTIGCSFNIQKGETAEQALKRMEKDRNFS